jgi:hypothetical protein
VKKNEAKVSTRSILLFEKAIILCKVKDKFYKHKDTILLGEYKFGEELILPRTTSNPSSASKFDRNSVSNLNSLTTKYTPFEKLKNNFNIRSSMLNLNSSSVSNETPSSLRLISLDDNRTRPIYQIFFKVVLFLRRTRDVYKVEIF